MSNIYGIMYTGRSSLLATQAAISATSNNIANADADGYSRQTVTTSASDPLKTTYGLIGTGVDVTAVTRAQDTFLEKQIVAENENLGQWDALSQALSLVETVFTEDDDYGLNAALSDFWNGWQDLAKNPDGDTERSALISYADTLVDTFNSLSSNLQDIQRELETSVDGVVDDINSIAEQIAELNQQIASAEADGQTANTYRDSRDSLLEELSQLIDVNYYESDNGMITVSVAGGTNLVEGISAASLSAEVDSSTGELEITLTGESGGDVVITDKITGGELKGFVEARDEYITGYLDSLDELASAIMTEVNALHSSGYGLDGSTGYALFTGSSAIDMAVNQNLIDDHDLIAASATSDGIPGDNGTALAIAALEETLVMSGGDSTFGEYYGSLVSEVGSAVETADNNVDYYTDVAASLDNLKQSITGVSIDEETVNLVMLQSAYDAAAKIINIVDEMLDTLLEIA